MAAITLSYGAMPRLAIFPREEETGKRRNFNVAGNVPHDDGQSAALKRGKDFPANHVIDAVKIEPVRFESFLAAQVPQSRCIAFDNLTDAVADRLDYAISRGQSI